MPPSGPPPRPVPPQQPCPPCPIREIIKSIGEIIRGY